MSKEQGLYQSLAACGAVLIAFIGVCHEVVDATLFPWGPAFFGGAVGWHGVGVLAIVTGLALLAGSLRLIRFPVAACALIVVAAPAAVVTVASAVTHRQFHMFALTLVLASAATAFFHRKGAWRPTPL